VVLVPFGIDLSAAQAQAARGLEIAEQNARTLETIAGLLNEIRDSLASRKDVAA
jgi:hypothetical protein